MRPATALGIAVVLAVVLGGSTLPPAPTDTAAARDPAGRSQLSGGPLAEPGEGALSSRSSGAGPPDGAAYAAALQQAAVVPESPLASLNPWVDRGPHNIGGRQTDLALSPDGRTIYAAAASGGLWASRDGGATLQPIWPADLTPAIGAVAVTADGVLLVGTGEANAGGGSLTFGGTGAYRSTDGGTTWDHVGLERSGTIARIVVDPTRPGRIHLAAGGDLFTPGGQRGIYRSDDAGLTWERVLAPATATAGGADIALDPSDPDHLLATTWDRLRTPDRRRYGGEGSGLYRSRDGGGTWQPVAGGLPGFGPDSGRIAIDFSPADPRRVYAVVTRGDGRAGGLWRSEDAGANWARVDDSPLYEPSQFIFGWWFSKVFAAPEDPDRVLVPGLSLLESTDGGVTFRPDNAVHADQHDLIWDPADPRRAWLATDGGMYASDAGGATLTWRGAEDQGFTQLYDVAVPPPAAGQVVGGFQDNGCLRTGGEADGWGAVGRCGDGVAVLPHPDRAEEVILCGQYGRCRLSLDGGATSRPLALPAEARANWSAPLIRVPGQPDRLLFGDTGIHRSDDGGGSWQAISGDLTRGVSPDPDYPFGTVTALAADPDGRIAVGTDDGLVWRSADGGEAWQRIASLDRWITAVVLDPGGGVVVGTSGYRGGEDTPQVLLVAPDGSSDEVLEDTAGQPGDQPDGRGGDQILDLTVGLPNAPVNDLVPVDLGDAGPALVAATDVGVFLRPGALGDAAAAGGEGRGQPWRRVGPDLPQAPVTALDWQAPRRQLTAGTYGRGAWSIPLPALTRHAGTDRYATAAAILATTPTEDVGTVVLASGQDFPDALAAAALVAADPRARLVLTRPRDLPAASSAVLADLSPSALLIVGGPEAVSDAVVTAAVEAATPRTAPADQPPPTVRRLSGPSRYATAAAVARHAAPGGEPGDGAAGTVVLATAGSPFDALAGAPYAASRDAPVLLVDPDRLPEATASALAELAPETLVALGGATAIGEDVLTAAAAAAGGASVVRLAGPSRDATAAAVADAMAAAPVVWLAADDRVPDALAAAATGAPVLLSGRDALSPVTAAALEGRGAVQVRLAGGPAVLSDALVGSLLHGP